MFWTSERYRELRPDVAKRQAKESYRLEDAIHTVIDLASLSNPDFVKSKSILS